MFRFQAHFRSKCDGRLRFFSWEQNIMALHMCKNEHTHTTAPDQNTQRFRGDAQHLRALMAFAPEAGQLSALSMCCGNQ